MLQVTSSIYRPKFNWPKLWIIDLKLKWQFFFLLILYVIKLKQVYIGYFVLLKNFETSDYVIKSYVGLYV